MVQTKTIPPISQRSRILWKVLLNLYFLFSLDGNLYSSNEIYHYKTALENQSSLSKFGTEFGTCALRRTRVISLLSLTTIYIWFRVILAPNQSDPSWAGLSFSLLLLCLYVFFFKYVIYFRFCNISVWREVSSERNKKLTAIYISMKLPLWVQ